MSPKKKILVCDDEEGVRESLNLILKDHHDVSFVKNGPECLEALQKDPSFDVVFMDIKMPKRNGIDVTRDIKSRHPNIKVIIVTGYASSEIAQEAFAAGADDYIAKPFGSKEILKKVGDNS